MPESDIHQQANDLIDSQEPAMARALNALMNYFYAASQSFETAERDRETYWTVEAVMHGVEQALDFLGESPPEEARYVTQTFNKAGLGAEDLLAVRDAALRVCKAVAEERIDDGYMMGNGHHARQEISARAIVEAARALHLTT